MITPAPFDQDVSVVKLVREALPISQGGPAIVCGNEDGGFSVLFPETPALLRILDGKPEAYVRARFVGCVLVFGERVEDWNLEDWEIQE